MTPRRPAREPRPPHRLSCPVVLHGLDGVCLARGRTVLVSNQGLTVRLPRDQARGLAGELQVRLSVPRRTPHSLMFEDVHARAAIATLDAQADPAMLTLTFLEPLRLDWK